MEFNGVINNISKMSDGQINEKTLSEDRIIENVNITNINKDTDIAKSVDELNKLLKKNNTHAEYSVYKELNRTIIKIIDDNTNKVIMEIPKEKLLDAVAAIMKNTGLLDEKA